MPQMLAEEVARDARIPLIERELVFAGNELEHVLVHCTHQRILLAAERAIAHRQFGYFRIDFELDGAAVARAAIDRHLLTLETQASACAIVR